MQGAHTRGLEMDVSAVEAGEVQNKAAMRLYCTLRLTGWARERVGRQGRFLTGCKAGQGRAGQGGVVGWTRLDVPGLVWRDVDVDMGVGCGLWDVW